MKLCIQGLTRSVLLLVVVAVSACGGGTEPSASPVVPSLKASVPSPAKKASTVTGGNAVAIHMYQALYGMAPSNALLLDYASQANNDASLFAKNLADRFTTTSHADLAKLVLDNLGVTPTTVAAINAKGESEYALLLDAVKQIFGAFPTMRGQVILNMTNLLAALESDITYGKAAGVYNGQAKANLAYSSNTANGGTKASVSMDVACSVQKNSYGDVDYPSRYLGAFPIPAPTLKLPPHVIRGIALKDDWITRGGPWSPATNSGCTDQSLYTHNLWIETLKRVRQDGADQTWIYNTEGWGAAPSAVTNEDLKFIVDEAKKIGLKVYYSWQYQTSFQIDDTLTLENLRTMLTLYHITIVQQAKYANQIGIDGIQADWAYPWIGKIQSDPVFKELWLTELSSIIDDIRTVFSGKIVVGSLSSIINSKIASKIDALGVIFIIRISEEENKLLTVDLLKAKYLEHIKWRYESISSDLGSAVNVPILWHVEIQSKYDFYVNGWTEDDFCVSNCVQRTYATDFSVQAIGTEAVLQAIKSQTYFNTYEVDIHSGYWYSDELVPRVTDETGFPNLGQNIRNKPAEDIVKYWFGR